MSQKDQEAAIDERIERIRKRNEEIQRRYAEVEADKLNAEKLNAAVKFSPAPVKNTERRNLPRPQPQPINKNPRFERKVPDKTYVAKPHAQGKKFSSFSDADGPPPDPVYTFLSDSSRDVHKGDHFTEEKTTKEHFSNDEFRGSRGGGRGRGWMRGRGNTNRGARRGAGNQPTRQSPQMQPDYQAWRAEREKIDQDRITRQKTAEGNWRREWDSKKLSQDENEEFHSRPTFSKKKKRDSEEFKIQRTVVNELAVSSPPPKEQEAKSLEKPSIIMSTGKGASLEKKTVAFKVNDGPSSETDKVKAEVIEFEHRSIINFGDSIKVSLSNKPIKSVRVNPVNTAGTGRVGPRQKPRLSYSSQSEDEKEVFAPILRKRTQHTNLNELSPSTTEDASKKPPLPPREKSSPRKKQIAGKNKDTDNHVIEKKELSRESSRENVSEGGDDSWEDVATTSGNESADFSDADVIRRPDDDDVTADEELIEEKTTIGKEDRAAEEEYEEDEVYLQAEVEELSNKKEELIEKEESSNDKELINNENDSANKNQELTDVKKDLSHKEEEIAINKESIMKEEKEPVPTEIVEVSEKKDEITIREDKRTDSLKICNELTLEKVLVESKDLISNEVTIENNSDTIVDQCFERSLPAILQDSKGKDSECNNLESDLSFVSKSKQEEICQINEDLKSEMVVSEEIKVDTKNEVTKNEHNLVLIKDDNITMPIHECHEDDNIVPEGTVEQTVQGSSHQES